MRKKTPFAGLVAVLALAATACGGGAPGGETSVAQPVARQGEALYQAAKKEGEVTWYVSWYDSETANAAAALFEKTYPGITVNVYRQTAQRLYQRFLQQQAAGRIDADVLGITEISRVEDLANEGLLRKFKPKGVSKLVSRYDGAVDDKGYYYTAAVGNNVIAYNTNKVSKAEAPKSFKDLLDAKWRGRVATGNPGASGYVGTWATQMFVMYGKDYFSQLAEQDVLVGQSITDVNPRLASGERHVGVVADQITALAIERGAPVEMIYPKDGAVVMPTPVAIPAQAPHPNAAQLFANFIYSDKYQSYMSENHALIPIIEGVETPDYVPENFKAIRPSLQQLSDNLDKVIDIWRREFGV